MSSAKPGLHSVVAVVLTEPLTYKYELYDDSDSQIKEPAGTRIRSTTGNEWVVSDEDVLKFNQGSIPFGPFKLGHDVGHVWVSVDYGDGFRYIGISEMDGRPLTVEQGETLRLGDTDDFTIDYTGSSSKPSSVAVTLKGVWDAVLSFDDLRNPSWAFQLRDDSGAVHDEISLSGNKVDWTETVSGIKYEGDSFSWNMVPSGFTVGSVEVYLRNGHIASASSGDISIPNASQPFSDPTIVTINSGDLTITL